MKKLLTSALLAALLTGCALWPKPVGYFEKKVKAVPTLPEFGQEHQRQAAQFVEQKTEEAKDAALTTHADTNVLIPVVEAHTAAQALSGSLGPPASAFTGEATNIAQTLDKDHAKLNQKVASYAADVAPEVGKKIEGTGIQVGYFTQWGILLGVVVLGYGAYKVYSTANPAVALAGNTVGKVASSVLSQGFSELVAGGEKFKDYIEQSTLGQDAKDLVNDRFSRAHIESQSQNVQTLVTQLTAKAPATTANPVVQPGVPTTPPAPTPAPIVGAAYVGATPGKT